jgi:hypothetical protein
VKPKRLVVLAGACITAVMLLMPADAAAQRMAVPRSGPVHSAHPVYYPSHYHSNFVVNAGFGFYNPFFFGFSFGYPFYYPFYSPFYAGWYPYWGYGGPYYPPYYGYYGGGGYYYGWSSARIEVKPRNAQVYLDGYYVGLVDQFDGTFQRLDLPPGEHEITVYDKAYHTFRQKTLFRPGETYHFKAILEPIPAGTAQDPVPTPTGPDPYSPDRYRDRGPRGQQDPNQGNPNQSYPDDPGRTQPMPERQPRGENRMEVGGFGTLNIRVQPGDAAVTIDGEKWDSPEAGSRLSIQLATGAHRIEVRKEGFRPYSTTIQIRAGETQSLNISLPSGGLSGVL